MGEADGEEAGCGVEPAPPVAAAEEGKSKERGEAAMRDEGKLKRWDDPLIEKAGMTPLLKTGKGGMTPLSRTKGGHGGVTLVGFGPFFGAGFEFFEFGVAGGGGEF